MTLRGRVQYHMKILKQVRKFSTDSRVVWPTFLCSAPGWSCTALSLQLFCCLPPNQHFGFYNTRQKKKKRNSHTTADETENESKFQDWSPMLCTMDSLISLGHIRCSQMGCLFILHCPTNVMRWLKVSVKNLLPVQMCVHGGVTANENQVLYVQCHSKS